MISSLPVFYHRFFGFGHFSAGAIQKEQADFWEKARNEKGTPCDWQFRTEDARIKLKRLYPTFAEPD
jgi:hypothetical protein